MEISSLENAVMDVNMHVCRDNDTKTERLQVFVVVWTKFTNMTIREVAANDLKHTIIHKGYEDELGILQLNLYVVPIENAEIMIAKQPIVLSKFIEFDRTTHKNLKFDNDTNATFFISVFPPNRPDGTKRRVITYEDSDVIDDTVQTNIPS